MKYNLLEVLSTFRCGTNANCLAARRFIAQEVEEMQMMWMKRNQWLRMMWMKRNHWLRMVCVFFRKWSLYTLLFYVHIKYIGSYFPDMNSWLSHGNNSSQYNTIASISGISNKMNEHNDFMKRVKNQNLFRKLVKRWENSFESAALVTVLKNEW